MANYYYPNQGNPMSGMQPDKSEQISADELRRLQANLQRNVSAGTAPFAPVQGFPQGAPYGNQPGNQAGLVSEQISREELRQMRERLSANQGQGQTQPATQAGAYQPNANQQGVNAFGYQPGNQAGIVSEKISREELRRMRERLSSGHQPSPLETGTHNHGPKVENRSANSLQEPKPDHVATATPGAVTEEQFIEFTRKVMDQIALLQNRIIEVEQISRNMLGEISRLQNIQPPPTQGHPNTNFSSYGGYPPQGSVPQLHYSAHNASQLQSGYGGANANPPPQNLHRPFPPY